MYKVLGVDQQEYGPVTAELVLQWISQRRLNGQSLALDLSTGNSQSDWKPLSQFPEFASALAQVAAPAQTTPVPGTLQRMDDPVYVYQRTHPMAMAGFGMGVFSLTFGMCCCYGFPFNVLGIIFAGISLSQISRQPNLYKGKGLAMTGLILSILSILVASALFLLGFAINSGSFMQDFMKEFQ